jgi:hypothetical protein
MVLPSAVNGTKLLAQEYQDALLLRYSRSPGDLLDKKLVSDMYLIVRRVDS